MNYQRWSRLQKAALLGAVIGLVLGAFGCWYLIHVVHPALAKANSPYTTP